MLLYTEMLNKNELGPAAGETWNPLPTQGGSSSIHVQTFPMRDVDSFPSLCRHPGALVEGGERQEEESWKFDLDLSSISQNGIPLSWTKVEKAKGRDPQEMVRKAQRAEEGDQPPSHSICVKLLHELLF
jgi:hypothetical protein